MKKELWLAIALLAYVAARLAPPVAGLNVASQAALAVTVAGTILWITEAVPLGVTALLVVVLLAINPGMRLPDALHGFTSEVTFFLVGVAAIGTAVEASGLAQRAARFLARSAKGDPTRLYVQMILALPALAFLVPSAITRNAILIPAYRDALDGMGVGKSGSVGRALMLALGMLNPLASSALLTGGIASIAAATLLGGFSWLGWFALMAVPYYALIFLGGIWLRMMVGPFETGGPCTVKPVVEPLSTAEIKTLAEGFADPTDALESLDPKKYATDDGDVDTEAIKADLAELLERKPHWAKPQQRTTTMRPNPAQGRSGQPAPSRAEQIATAQAAGDTRTVMRLKAAQAAESTTS